MNKKSIAGLLLFGCLVMASLIYGATLMTGNLQGADSNQSRIDYAEANTQKQDSSSVADEDTQENAFSDDTQDYAGEEPWLLTNPSDTGNPDHISSGDTSATTGDNPKESQPDRGEVVNGQDSISDKSENTITEVTNPSGATTEGEVEDVLASNIENGSILERESCRLIVDSSQVDYESYIPEMVSDSKVEAALNITNPSISIKAEAAILFDADTMEVLYYKNPVSPVFPASTAKLLTCLVALDWCSLEEEVSISNEIRLIAKDSTRAGLIPGETLTIQNLLEGMLLPSGNDAAYATATYVGRKSLKREGARREDAVAEFVRLMNEKARQLGAVNSCFKTPDGYDAIGQFTTAYDMGLISVEAAKNETIQGISIKAVSYAELASGREVTWRNTNALVRKDSGRYYSACIGLKTGTSTMAGKCLIAAAKANGREVVCVVMNSSQAGRWTDARTLLDYGLQ